MNRESTKKWITDEVRLIIATVTITVSILGTFYGVIMSIQGVKSDVRSLGDKLDNALTYMKEDRDAIKTITQNDAARDSKIAVLESKVNVKPVKLSTPFSPLSE